MHKVFALPSPPAVALFLKMRRLQADENCAFFFSNLAKKDRLAQDLDQFLGEANILTPLRELLYTPAFGKDFHHPPLPEPESVA